MHGFSALECLLLANSYIHAWGLDHVLFVRLVLTMDPRDLQTHEVQAHEDYGTIQTLFPSWES